MLERPSTYEDNGPALRGCVSGTSVITDLPYTDQTLISDLQQASGGGPIMLFFPANHAPCCPSLSATVSVFSLWPAGLPKQALHILEQRHSCPTLPSLTQLRFWDKMSHVALAGWTSLYRPGSLKLAAVCFYQFFFVAFVPMPGDSKGQLLKNKRTMKNPVHFNKNYDEPFKKMLNWGVVSL